MIRNRIVKKSNSKLNTHILHNIFRLDIAALSILLEFSLEIPHILFDFGGTQWFMQAITCSLTVYENSPIDGCLIQVFTSWLNSPLLRKRLELNLILQV